MAARNRIQSHAHGFAVAWTVVLGCLLLLGGCKKSTDVPSSTVISGRVVEDTNPDMGVIGATVRAIGKSASTVTDSIGRFSLQMTLASDETIQLDVSKPSYLEQSMTLDAKAGQTLVLPATVRLKLLANAGGGGGGGGGGLPSGPASSIIVQTISRSSIGVRHSGDGETSLLTFQVVDANGNPVDLAHQVSVHFTLTETLADSSFLSPDTVKTNSQGLATVGLNSGVSAQSVQVRAHVIGTNIYSIPVVVAVHGGPPAVGHYSFGVEKFNVPGLVTLGITDRVTAYLGDRYGNPVREGTVVYFASSGGIIQGSSTSDDHGRASVDLITAAPFPNDVPGDFTSDSAGIARVSVQTVDESGARLSQSFLSVMFSGHTELSISPTTFAVPLNGSQAFTITLWDREHHNPLTGGTTINVTASLGTLSGDATATVPDTRQRFTATQYTFTLLNPQGSAPTLVGPQGQKVKLTLRSNSPTALRTVEKAGSRTPTPTGVEVTKPATLTVLVTSPNGDAKTTISGTVDQLQ